MIHRSIKSDINEQDIMNRMEGGDSDSERYE
jgi:hypothetical protein